MLQYGEVICNTCIIFPALHLLDGIPRRPRNALFGKIQPVKVLACQPPKSKGGTGWQIDAEFPRQ